MTYAHITAEGIDAIGNPPRLEYDGSRWWDLRDPAIREARGWLEVTETPRPDDTTEGTHDGSVQLVDGLPVRVWTFRPWTAEELAAQALAVDRVAALEAIVVGNLPEPAEGEEPTFADLTAGDLREYDGTVYRCIQSHATQAGWTPPAVPALWTPQG